ncbi:MAG: hypothetical protein SVY10_17825, partial [Thermodesulfobacteriota bacterium]|nr:hypothetical protein [Thermodesulfobacteriota bacterium]
MKRTHLHLYIGVFLISVSTLTFEVSLTRIFSISLWYHFAFMVISIAMLGFGASGSLLMIFPMILNKSLLRTLSIIALLFSSSIVVSYLIVNQVPFDPARISWDHNQILFVLVSYFTLSIPFLLSGLVVSIAIARFPDKVGSLYFSNLMGAGLGCLFIFGVFRAFGGLGGILIPSLFGLLASLSFEYNKKLSSVTI